MYILVIDNYTRIVCMYVCVYVHMYALNPKTHLFHISFKRCM